MEDRLIQVCLREGSKPKRYILPADLEAEIGQWVVVLDEEEEDCGTVAGRPIPLPVEWEGIELPSVLEASTDAEVEKAQRLREEREPDAIRLAYEKVRERELDLKLVRARYYHRSNKMKLHFTAENRVDFRELVKDLAGVFHARIEMRQIGVRDAAGMVGGYGACGEELCCARFLDGFAPITIRMAKDQHLALNPGKISGCCGRLLCCLRYEHETYAEAKKRFPKMGISVRHLEQEAKVAGVNILKETVSLLADGQLAEIPLEEFKLQNPEWQNASKAKSPESSETTEPTAPTDEGVDEEALSALEDTVVRMQSKAEGENGEDDETSDSTTKPRRRRRRKRKSPDTTTT
jgi:cell fate regulator YaaT (PSP1 superfamily)